MSDNLIKVVNELQDKLSPLGIDNLALDLPQIAVIGCQSAGKSSVLESFVGRDFLPRGNNIVTRRPLVLQLINSKGPKSYGEFLHIENKKFENFSEIRDEITKETDREVKNNFGISSKPINLKIYSPDVLDLTLIDLPGMTRVPVGDQPKDIEARIEKMIFEYIKRENCLILAVTAANQDLATSDALKMAEKVDPSGSRTIGVLTKLDLMDKGTDARKILTGKHLPLKMGYIGVVNRSQEDIESKKDMKRALTDEQQFFRSHPSYRDIADKLGIAYLQKYLNQELRKHIMKMLPPLKHKFMTEFNEMNEELDKIESPLEVSDNEWILSETNEEFRRNYESSVGGKGTKINIKKLSGGAKINLTMNDTFAKDVNQMVYDEEMMRREIATAIQNYYGIYLGVFTPDAAFKAVVENQIELFRKPSMICVEWVSQDLEDVVRESIDKIKRFSNIKELYTRLTIDYVRECKKRCKAKVDSFVEAEKTYLNTIHEDFIAMTNFKSLENSQPISENQLKVSAQVVEERKAKQEDTDTEGKSGWISYKKTSFWFVLNGQTLTWYRDNKLRDKRGTAALVGAQLKQGENKQPKTLVLILGQKKGFFNSNNSMELVFDSTESVEQWKEWLEEIGIGSNGSESSFYTDSDTKSLTKTSLSASNSNLNLEEDSRSEMAYADHLKSPVDQVKTLVDSYVVITKKKFKDIIPKICTIEMIDATRHFIEVELRVRIRGSIESDEDIIGGDPDEQIRRDLVQKSAYYSEAIEIIDKFTKFDTN